uniref:Nucleoplasmin core domain-containing protein n=2 Tax=Eptatretus burgeri TaxID=7764 RepID=A0A8C4R9J0_EPTBU
MNGSIIDDEMYQNIRSYTWGCCLTTENKEFTVHKEEYALEHQLIINTVCLDEMSMDELHVVEVEGFSLNGSLLSAVLAVLRPPYTTMISLSGCEWDPPILLRLRSGSGPLHLCGRNIVRSFDSHGIGSGIGTGIENENQDEEPVVEAGLGKDGCNGHYEEAEKEKEDESAIVGVKEDEHQDDSHLSSPELLGTNNKMNVRCTRSHKGK